MPDSTVQALGSIPTSSSQLQPPAHADPGGQQVTAQVSGLQPPLGDLTVPSAKPQPLEASGERTSRPVSCVCHSASQIKIIISIKRCASSGHWCPEAEWAASPQPGVPDALGSDSFSALYTISCAGLRPTPLMMPRRLPATTFHFASKTDSQVHYGIQHFQGHRLSPSTGRPDHGLGSPREEGTEGLGTTSCHVGHKAASGQEIDGAQDAAS